MKRLATGIYEDEYSIQAVVDGAAGRKTKRFPHGTSLLEIRLWRETTKVKLAARARRRRPTNSRHTLKADVRAYLRTLTIGSVKSRRSDIGAWLDVPITPRGARRATTLGQLSRHAITIDDVRAAVQWWQTDGRIVGVDGHGEPRRRPYAAWTIKHRVHALRDLYRVLDGEDAETPLDRLKLTKPPKTTPVFVTPLTILDVAAELARQAEAILARQKISDKRKNLARELRQTRGRHLVIATHGVRPSELMRTQRTDVDLDNRMWPVRTAKGGIGRVLRLTTGEMIDAWKEFIDAEAFGEFDTTRHARLLRLAGWPAGVRPYALRGTWGMELSRRGADLSDIQQLLGHADVRTTRAYYVPPEDSRLAAATRSTAGRLKWK